MISGSGIIHSEFGDFNLEQGDAYFFKKAEKFFIQGNNLFVGIFNAPKWTLEQYKHER